MTLVYSDKRQYFCHAQWGKDHYFCESYSGFKEYQSLKIVGKLKIGRKYVVFCDKEVTFNNGISATLISEINKKI